MASMLDTLARVGTIGGWGFLASFVFDQARQWLRARRIEHYLARALKESPPLRPLAALPKVRVHAVRCERCGERIAAFGVHEGNPFCHERCEPDRQP
jgi:hypothetical protein